ELGLRPERIEPASSDASFRRYFRAFADGRTFVVMDAPPDKEEVRPYLKVTRLLQATGVHVPRVHALMPEWFCKSHLQLSLSAGQQQTLATAFEFLIREALAQPSVFVHRDYHSRNLMVVADRNPGVLDFQDALRGPVG